MSKRNNNKSRTYSNKEKLEHYSKRVNDKTLRQGQRNYAKQRVAELCSQQPKTLSQTQQILTGAHLANIKNKYMFNSDKPEQEHCYVVYFDEKSQELRAIETTHLYKADEKNMNKLKRNLLHKVHFEGNDTPSGTNNYYYNTDINGLPLDLTNKSIKLNEKELPESLATEIKNFAKKARKR